MNPNRPDVSLAVAKSPPWSAAEVAHGGDIESSSDDMDDMESGSDDFPRPLPVEGLYPLKSPHLKWASSANPLLRQERSMLRTSQPPTQAQNKRTARRPGKTRLGLPITLNKEDGAATVLACADTGAEVNVMSQELAQSLGYTDYERATEPAVFELANGNTVQSLGQVTASCSFGVDADVTAAMSCMFHIFLRAASPIIMGLGFLEETKTMTEHRNRLVLVPRPNLQALSVCSLNRPRQLLSCELNYKPMLVTLDSGSDIDVISSKLAQERNFMVHPEEHVFEQADGSLAVSPGFVRLSLSIAKPRHHKSIKPTHTEADFFVLEGLIHDALVGEDSQMELDVFGQHQHAIVPATDVAGPLGVARIRYLSTMDRILSWIKNKITHKRRPGDQGNDGE